jgi:hypothetical protein
MTAMPSLKIVHLSYVDLFSLLQIVQVEKPTRNFIGCGPLWEFTVLNRGLRATSSWGIASMASIGVRRLWEINKRGEVKANRWQSAIFMMACE